MKIYLANSLTHAPEEYKSEMAKLRSKLSQDHEVSEYLGLINGNAEAVFRHDIGCVKNCDLLLAEVSYPSTGLGFEIATGLNLGKKVLAVAQKDAKVTRMILGIQDPNFKIIRYASVGDILIFLKQYL
jgi:nucleoside 2-deoxyribosyltransferase